MSTFESVIAMLAANPILCAALAITFLLMGALVVFALSSRVTPNHCRRSQIAARISG